MAENYETGKTGEAVARKYLEDKEYKILDVNWHFHHYELDIVATDGKYLVIIEVKTRSDNYMIAPEMSIDKPKIQRIVSAADAYSRMKKIDLPIRFDVISLIKQGGNYILDDHYEDAFYAPVRTR